MFNPHSAKQRIQNHLAYRLGLALIQYDKQRKGIFNYAFNSKETNTINSKPSRSLKTFSFYSYAGGGKITLI